MNQFYTRLGVQYEIRPQSPIRLTVGSSQPEPDLVIAQPSRTYAQRHPTAEDSLLVIEIVDSTLDKDRETKGELYARASLQEYWIMNLVNNLLEVYSEPRIRANGVGMYQSRQIYSLDQQVAPLAFPDLVIAVNEIFPEIEE